jgi:hypothetical protein
VGLRPEPRLKCKGFQIQIAPEMKVK